MTTQKDQYQNKNEQVIIENTQEQNNFIKNEVSPVTQTGQQSSISIIHVFIFIIAILMIYLLFLSYQSSVFIDEIKNDDSIKYYQITNITAQQLLIKIQIRPQTKIQSNTFTYKFKPTPRAYLAYNLHRNTKNTQYLEAEHLYYQQKYNIDQYQQQLPLCIVSVGFNLLFQQRLHSYLQSIRRLKYDNYKVILIDDASNDGTYQKINSYFKSKMSDSGIKNFYSKFKIIRNQQRMYALWNRNYAIRQHCQSDDIIVQIDPDDVFIGAQVLKFINYIYQDPNIWVFYSNYVYWSPDYAEPTEGISGKIPKKLLLDNTYRISDKWLSSATRTFRQKIYTKINESDFIDHNFPSQYENNKQPRFYKWCADLFMHYSLVQLAGPEHYKYIDQIFYYYYLTHNNYEAQHKKLDRFTSYMITPYQKLQNLNDQAKRVRKRLDIYSDEQRQKFKDQGYRIPQWIVQKHQELLLAMKNQKN